MSNQLPQFSQKCIHSHLTHLKGWEEEAAEEDDDDVGGEKAAMNNVKAKRSYRNIYLLFYYESYFISFPLFSADGVPAGH